MNIYELNRKQQTKARGAEQVGSEYILELIGSESAFKNKKLYIHCILCDYYGEISDLKNHQIDTNHRINFLEIHYPKLAKIIKNRKLFETESIKLLLDCVFDGIFLHYPKENYSCPQVKQTHYIENEEAIKKSILSSPRRYNPLERFAITMEQFIEKNYPEKEKEVSVQRQNSNNSADLEKQIKSATASIERKYKRIKKRLNRGPGYLEEYREFYLNYAYHLASLEPLYNNYYNYIDEFHTHYIASLDSKMKDEIEKKKEEIENLSKSGLEDVSDDEDDEDVDVKIVENKVETVSVSSDCESEYNEPVAKKYKPSLDCDAMMRAIKFAHILVQKGEEPTIEGLKKAFLTNK